MRKILFILLFIPAISNAMEPGGEAQPLLPHPPSYENVAQGNQSRYNYPIQMAKTGFLGILWTYAMVAQLIPADQIFTPESETARHAWWGTALASQMIIGFLALYGIWR